MSEVCVLKKAMTSLTDIANLKSRNQVEKRKLQQDECTESSARKCRKSKRKLKLREDSLDCPLCSSLLHQPVTTSCGHTFCRSCILRVMDHANRCPLCRTVIYITPENGISVLLQKIIEENFPVQYRQRQAEIQKELKEQKFNLPLFLLGDTILFPQMALPLHVFEPRYRLMIRRCLEGGRRFGIVPTINGELGSIGTTAVIENHWILPDGRSLIATVGDSRFKVLDVWDQDGYKVAKVDYIQDEQMAEETQPLVDDLFNKAKGLVCKKFCNATLDQIQEKLGKMPMSNATEFSWWLAYVLPVPVEKKFAILNTKSIGSRLEILIDNLHSLDLSELESSSNRAELAPAFENPASQSNSPSAAAVDSNGSPSDSPTPSNVPSAESDRQEESSEQAPSLN